MSNDKYTLFEDIVRKTARFVARDFPEVEWEDLFQDLMMFVLQNHNLRDPDASYVAGNLVKKCTKFAWEYRKQTLSGTSQYSYRTSDVKRILETAFDRESWGRTIVPDDARSIGLSKDTSALFEDKMIANLDVRDAFQHLSDTYKKAIFSKYALLEEPSDESEKRRLYRAIERLTDILNFYPPERKDHEGVGSRKAISNAQAGATIQDQT